MLRKCVLRFLLPIALLGGLMLPAAGIEVSEETAPLWPPSPLDQSRAEAHAKTAGCMSCHLSSDEKTMHKEESVILGCADCHGGDASIFAPPELNLADS